jgi:2-methylcitrate dehydratase PrpD
METTLAAYIAQQEQDLPREVCLSAKQHLIDSVAAIVSGSALHAGKQGIAYAERLGGNKESCIPGTRVRTSAVNAAMASGMCAHADETDDSHQPAFFHPGCAIVPAALAVAEREHASGWALLRALVLGYDVGARVGLCLGAMKFHQRGHSSHSFGALFGAAAAAGSLARLTADQCRWMLSYATQQASGISSWMRDRDHVEKAFVIGGMPARNGVYAATMVQSGMTAVDDPFTGSPNLFSAYAPNAVMEELVRGLGSHYEILRSNIKKWSVGSPVQAALDAMEALIRDYRLTAADVVHIKVEVRDDEADIVNDRSVPNICMQHLLALMLVDGTLTFATTHDAARMGDERVLQVRDRIVFAGSARLRRAGGRQALLEIVTRDHGTLRQHIRAVRGSADNPMSDEEVTAKSEALTIPVLGRRRARRLSDILWRIDEIKDVGELRPFLRA